MHHPTDMIAHTTAFVTPVVEHWLEREIAQCVISEEGNVLFNATLKTFYFRLYGVGHVVEVVIYRPYLSPSPRTYPTIDMTASDLV